MFVVKKKNIIIAVILITIITIIVCFGAIVKNTSKTVTASNYKIVIDAGHGGIDAGVSGVNSGVKESDLNLILSKKLSKILADAGFSTVLTRKTEAGLYGIASGNLKRKDMQKRKEIILEERPNVVISIHLNKFSLSTRRGAQVFFKNSDEKGKLLAKSVQNAFNEMEEATRECSALSGDYYILNCSDYPSIITECGFLSNPEDERLLLTEEYQDKIVYAIFKGIIEYFSQLSFNFTH